MYWEQTLILYLVIGCGVAVAVYLATGTRPGPERGFQVGAAVFFWPLFLPLLLSRPTAPATEPNPAPQSQPDEMASLIAQVEEELEGALQSLGGWAEEVLAKEEVRLQELRSALRSQADRIREMDRLLARSESGPNKAAELPKSDRIRGSEKARLANLDRLRQVRERTYQDLMGTLAWLRELVTMIHLAKFTGAPASRAEELVAQIAAVVEGLSALTWQEEPAAAGS
jgi:ElaB/YqjD/DUF883 family membrane-anchored ribosome-binding protein